MVTNRDDVSIAIRSAFLKKETKQKFSLIALIIASFIFLYLDSLENKPLNLIRSFIKDAVYRGSTIVSLPSKGISFTFGQIGIHISTHKENIKLKKENTELKSMILDQNFLKTENKELKKLLNQEMETFTILKRAKVIIDKESPFLKSVILNKGSQENILKGMAVLDGKYFIGRIVEVNFFSSRVLLVTDLNSKIPVVIEPHAYQSILSGTGGENPILEYLPKNHKVEVGNSVYTSGKDGIFSPGIPIGKTIIVDDKVFVSLYSDSNQLSYVNVDIGHFGRSEK